MADNEVIGWDDEVDVSTVNEKKNDEIVTLPAGDYTFTVNKVERGHYNGSEKLPACGMVKVGVIVDGGDLGHGYVTARFYMVKKCLWSISTFLQSIGITMANGVIPWDKVTKGMKGSCKIKVREWNGNKQNEVERWLESSTPTTSNDDEY